MKEYQVRYRSINGGYPLWLGGAGRCVNTGAMKSSSTVINQTDAIKYTFERAKRLSRNCSASWYGEVVKGDEVVYVTKRGRKLWV